SFTGPAPFEAGPVDVGSGMLQSAATDYEPVQKNQLVPPSRMQRYARRRWRCVSVVWLTFIPPFDFLLCSPFGARTQAIRLATPKNTNQPLLPPARVRIPRARGIRARHRFVLCAGAAADCFRLLSTIGAAAL